MRRTPAERVAAVALWPAARMWSMAASVRTRLYDAGVFPRRHLRRPVVSVGNLSAGGTGKTPFVIWLFSELLARGVKPAVLTRGYKRPGARDLLLTRNGANPDALSAGDEAQLMLRRGVAPIGVGADRHRTGSMLETDLGVELHILDDGFQHLQLGRDLDIVLLDCTRPPWQDDLLPAGRLREPLHALARAHIIVLTRVQKWTEVPDLESRLRAWAPRAAIFTARTCLLGNSGALPAGPVLAFAGIGNPRAFFADLCVAGVQVVRSEPFADHYRYSVRDLLELEKRARDAEAEALVTTEKDAMNLPHTYRNGLDLPVRVVTMKLEIDRGEELVERVLSAIHK